MSTIQGKGHARASRAAFVLAGRYLAGRDLDGGRATNATWWRHADRDLTTHQRAGRWAHKRHAERMLWRTGALAVTAVTLYGYVTARHVTLICGAVTLGCGAALAVWRVTLAMLRARHTRRTVRPLYQTLAPLAALPPGDNPSRYLSVPRSYKTNAKAQVKLWLSPKWEGSITSQKAISAVVSRRLGGDYEAYFHQSVYPPYAIFNRALEPPRVVTLDEFAPFIDGVPENVLALGRGAGNKVISFSLDSEAPHVGVSMSTGAGKSVFLALVIASLVRKGADRIDIVDPKMISQQWSRGLPGVFIHRYADNQITAIRDTAAAMQARYQALEMDDSINFPRRVLIIEEMGSLIIDLEQHWADYRAGLSSAERGSTPRKNPALNDLRSILMRGRQCKINIIAVSQRLSANVAGGGDARENFGARIVARSSVQTWKMLTGSNVMPSAARSRIPGRAVLALGDEFHAVQLAYAPIAKPDGSADRDGIARLRAFALNSRPDAASQPVTASVPVPGPEPVAASETGELVTLREACASGALSLRYGAACKARQRDREFPAPVHHGLYRANDLVIWQRNRIRAGQAA